MYFLIKTILTSTYKHVDYTSYVDYTGIRFILSDLQQVAPKSILMQMAPDHFFQKCVRIATTISMFFVKTNFSVCKKIEA